MPGSMSRKATCLVLAGRTAGSSAPACAQSPVLAGRPLSSMVAIAQRTGRSIPSRRS